jgi:hypothetical protein
MRCEVKFSIDMDKIEKDFLEWVKQHPLITKEEKHFIKCQFNIAKKRGDFDSDDHEELVGRFIRVFLISSKYNIVRKYLGE